MLIKVDNLHKEFKTGEVVTKVLHGLSFIIEKSEFVAIMGPSGSGKSTLMHILGMLDKASSGHYFFEDQDVTGFDDDQLAGLRNARIGFVFQAFNLLPRTSVLDNVKLPLTYAAKSHNIEDRAKEVLDQVGLGHRLNHYSNQLSGGEKQRVAIARALVNHPSVIFADEPTGNLDSKSGIQVLDILQKLNENGSTIILVTHETYTAEHAKRIIRIVDGKINEDRQVENRRFAKTASMLK